MVPRITAPRIRNRIMKFVVTDQITDHSLLENKLQELKRALRLVVQNDGNTIEQTRIARKALNDA